MTGWRALVLVVAALVLPGPAAAQGVGGEARGKEIPDWVKLSFLDIRSDLEEAKNNGEELILYFWQEGCPYCQKLVSDNFGDPEIARKTREHFDVVAINMWGDREVTGFSGKRLTEKKFAGELDVMFTPTLLFLGPEGEVAYRMNGYYAPAKFDLVLDYVTGDHYQQAGFADYYRQRRGLGALAGNGDNGAEPRRIAGGDKPYLAVVFVEKDCEPCEVLTGDILWRGKTQELIQPFRVTTLNRWADTPIVTPADERTTARKWAADLKVDYTPTVVFMRPEGEEAFRTESFLQAFHFQSALQYVATDAYREQPSFQRFIQERADRLEAEGVEVNLME